MRLWCGKLLLEVSIATYGNERTMEGWYRGVGMMQCHHLHWLKIVAFLLKPSVKLHFWMVLCSTHEREVWHLGAPLKVSLIKRENQNQPQQIVHGGLIYHLDGT